MELSRRTFLRIGGVTAVSLVSGYLVVQRTRRALKETADPLDPAMKTALNALRDAFPNLKFSESTAIEYIEAYRTEIRALNLEVLRSWDFYRRFLLSTNLFTSGRREEEPLRFVNLYHPYITPCHNPLASY